jgi:ABC-type glycerol-3-phosphate transport system substrate-binding protein
MRSALGVIALAAGSSFAASAAMSAELVFWSMWNETEPQAKALQQIMDNYTAAHPDTTFKVAWNGRQNQTKLRSALQAGTPVDFMDQDSDQLAGGLQKEGLALDLTGELDAELKAAMLPGTLEIFAKDGKIFQLPYIYNTVNFWYNKEMLAEAGAHIPKTWDELLAVCEAVKGIGKHALVIESDVAFFNIMYFSLHLERQLGPWAVVKVFEDKTGESWRSAEVLAAAKAMPQLWDKGCIAPDARGFKWPAGEQTIALGDTMGELVGSWVPTELAETAGPDFPWGAFNFPEVPGGVGKITDIQVAPLSLLVLKDSPNAAQAVDFVKFLMSAEQQKILVDVGGVGVTRAGVAWPPALADAAVSAAAATALSPISGGLNVNYADFTAQTLYPEFNKMFLGETTAEQFVDTLANATKKYWESRS